MLTRRDFGKAAAATAAVTATPLGARAANRPTITIAVDNLWANIAPINGISTTTQRFFPNLYEILIERDFTKDPNGLVLKPRLATKWERDGAIWRFEMRQGVKFHNGEEVTAEDAAFTLGADRLWGPKPFEPRGRSFTPGFKRVEATGKYTFEIETERPDPNIPNKLTGYIGFVVPKKYYLDVGIDKYGQMPISAGPYKCTSFNSGDALVLDAFDDYYDGPPPAQRLIFKIIPEFSARLAGLVSGEFQFIVNIPTDQEKAVESYKGIKMVRKTANNYPGIIINTLPNPPDNPLVDPKLRYALVQGANYDDIVKTLFGDATFHPAVPFNLPDNGPFYDPNAKPALPYDPDKARALVKQTKYDGKPLLFHITRSFYPNYESAAEILVEQWRDVGINVEAQILDNFDLVYRRPYHLMNVSNSTTFIPGDPYQPLWLDWGPAGGATVNTWKAWEPTPKFLEIGQRFANDVDFETRKKDYLELSAEWQRITPGIFLWRTVYNWAHQSNITWLPVTTSEMRFYGDYVKFS